MYYPEKDFQKGHVLKNLREWPTLEAYINSHVTKSATKLIILSQQKEIQVS